MELREALETAARILKTGERVELQPTKDGAEVYDHTDRIKIMPDSL